MPKVVINRLVLAPLFLKTAVACKNCRQVLWRLRMGNRLYQISPQTRITLSTEMPKKIFLERCFPSIVITNENISPMGKHKAAASGDMADNYKGGILRRESGTTRSACLERSSVS